MLWLSEHARRVLLLYNGYFPAHADACVASATRQASTMCVHIYICMYVQIYSKRNEWTCACDTEYIHMHWLVRSLTRSACAFTRPYQIQYSKRTTFMISFQQPVPKKKRSEISVRRVEPICLYIFFSVLTQRTTQLL